MVRQRSKDNTDETRNVADQLAVLDDVIIASDAVISNLNLELHKLTRPLTDTAIKTAVHTVDWRREIPTAAFGTESL
ncbi:MAG: hypothetical protein J0653_02270, partial [Deltaproteobacteria bacterium]|nr:hypothetical protein [Deltaproteobacteria bacterium]